MATIVSPQDDDIVEEPRSSSMDYAAHERMFNAFISVGKWFVVHLAILLVALYFAVIAAQPGIALFLLLCSVALLVYGVLHRPSVRADVAKGLSAAPAAAHRRTVDRSPGKGDATA